MEGQLDRNRIAEEAVGQKHGSAPAYAAKKTEMSQEEAAGQLAASSGAQASTPEKTAESLGERVADAYADPARVPRHPKRNGGRLTATGPQNREENNGFRSVGRGVTQERLLTVVAGFALGYFTAVLFHGRINAALGTPPGPFQITRPPQGDRHPRGFVQSTVLKAITEHPQGMTTAEIITELGPQGIGQTQSSTHSARLFRRKKSVHKTDWESSFLPRRRCRPHRISRALSLCRAEPDRARSHQSPASISPSRVRKNKGTARS